MTAPCDHPKHTIAMGPDGLNAICTRCDARLVISPCCPGFALPMGRDGEVVGKRVKRTLIVPAISCCMECGKWWQHSRASVMDSQEDAA